MLFVTILQPFQCVFRSGRQFEIEIETWSAGRNVRFTLPALDPAAAMAPARASLTASACAARSRWGRGRLRARNLVVYGSACPLPRK